VPESNDHPFIDRLLKILNHRVLVGPLISFGLVAVLVIGTASIIYYVQHTLSGIEKDLPIKLMEKERDGRMLVNEMGRLVQSIKLAQSDRSQKAFNNVVRQIHQVEKDLQNVRNDHRFKDVLDVTAIHAILFPVIVDIKHWSEKGLTQNIGPTSEDTLHEMERRASLAYEEAEIELLDVSERAVFEFRTQGRRIEDFRNIMIFTLVILALMTTGLVMLGLRLQRILLALKESEEQIRYRANYDSLTHLPNRPNFIEHLAEAISRSHREPSQTALLFIDLDRFKTINDTLGHDFGDELIKQVAVRIRESVRETDVVSRLGGDEFTVLLPRVTDEIHASIVAKGILARLSGPFRIFGHEVYSSASIGITICPQDGEDANTLLKNADMAMYEAKEQGRNTFRFFTSQMTDRARMFLEVDKDLHRALAEDELRLHYQPIYELPNRRLTGVEALLRWQHPEKGLIMPARFIEVAEETGLIDEIGRWVLRQAFKDAISWVGNDFPAGFYLSVNISMRQFRGGFDRREVEELLDETGFPAEHLMLELTESLLMSDDRHTRDVLSDLRKLGVRLGVDDFGTGYSALSYLREFPVSTLKIDRSFIQDISANRSNRRLVEAIITMAHGLDLSIVAEGVETSEQHALLSELRCDMVQGHYYCKPVSAERIANLTSFGAPRVITGRFD
jgi:diguanylate cyclase (GGDEF)-like protein